MQYHDFLSYKLFENSKNDMVIKKGDLLFHGTSEDFDISDIKPSGYDNILWTAKESGIAQMYIPVSGSKTIVSSSSLAEPTTSKNIQSLQQVLGIPFKDIKIENGRVVSYIKPDIFKKIDKEYHTAYDDYDRITKEYTELEKEFMDNKDSRKEIKDRLLELAKEKQYAKEKIGNLWPEKKKIEYITAQMLDNGYKPKEKYADNNHRWELRLTSDRVLKPDERLSGRLLIIKPQRDIRIYDYVKESEGDLTDLDYHKLDLFRKVEEKGYDGIYINDFAQSDTEGNLGHRSIGLFPDTIKDLSIHSIRASHPTEEDVERMFKTREWDSREYLEWKKNQK